MGSGLLGTNILAGNGFFGFDPTPNSSITNTLRNAQAGNFRTAPDTNYNAPQVLGDSIRRGGSTTAGQTSAPQNTGAADAQAASLAAARAQYGDPSQYDSQIGQYQSQLGTLDPSVGLQNNQNSYQLQQNRLAQNGADAQRQYDAGVQQNTQTYQANRTKTLNATRANANALQRLLGMNGAGNSSASYEQAPYAAALQGSQDLNAAQQTFGTNAQNLDLQNGMTKRKLEESQQDLNNQKFQSDNSVRSSIAQSRADLLSKIDQASQNRNLASGRAAGPAANQGEIASLLQQIQQLGKNYASPIQAKTVETAPLTLSDYAQGRQLTAQNQGNAGGTDISQNFISSLLGKRNQYGELVA